MEHFEQELASMMREGHGQEGTGYEDRHRRRLYAAVRARQRTRRAWMATASALTIAGLGAVLMTLPNSFAQSGPTAPDRRPATSAEPLPSRSAADGAPRPGFTSGTVPVASPHHPATDGKRTT
ncbi:hypothetical protein DI272_25420 [Streptomyces sp. Act143]|uniref:hypothetical protein n=1 Tax=Streptomyces sp. Act143 TaxID=2200760 RepID=UPI000D678167|nr:hypothetical protein [Streptomyces sp. Act143]PWI17124.1 hypothetical protein DI272_25420 [Streptomyces sp. Act143]